MPATTHFSYLKVFRHNPIVSHCDCVCNSKCVEKVTCSIYDMWQYHLSFFNLQWWCKTQDFALSLCCHFTHNATVTLKKYIYVPSDLLLYSISGCYIKSCYCYFRLIISYINLAFFTVIGFTNSLKPVLVLTVFKNSVCTLYLKENIRYFLYKDHFFNGVYRSNWYLFRESYLTRKYELLSYWL